VLLLNECLLLRISLPTRSGNFWIHPRKLLSVPHGSACSFSFVFKFFGPATVHLTKRNRLLSSADSGKRIKFLQDKEARCRNKNFYSGRDAGRVVAMATAAALGSPNNEHFC
jgi:hypothetical protein